MRILVVTSGLSADFKNGTLPNDLVTELSRQGHEILVYAQDWWGSAAGFEGKPPVEILWQTPAGAGLPSRFMRTAAKWWLTSSEGWRDHGDRLTAFKPDLVVMIGIASIHRGIIEKLETINPADSVAIIWDFFPDHQSQIGKLPGFIPKSILRGLETRLLSRFKRVGLMSPANIAYFRSHYPTAAQKAALETIPIWGPASLVEEDARHRRRSETRKLHDMPLDRPVAIFGGQIVEGRGFEDIVAAAAHLEASGSDLFISIFGDGPLRERLSGMIAQQGLQNIKLHGRVSRHVYQDILQAGDIGIVSTVSGVDVPTFPSKSLDYMRNRLPIVASVERSGDFGTILAKEGAGLACEAGDTRQFAENLERMASDPALREEIAGNAARYYQATHGVDRVARLVTGDAEGL